MVGMGERMSPGWVRTTTRLSKEQHGERETGMSGSPSPFAQWWAKPTMGDTCKPRAKLQAIFRIRVICCGARSYERWDKMRAGKK